MLSWIREKFGTAIIGTIISLIALVFVFYGVFSPKSTRGLHDGAVAGTVNGDAISISEFNRELNRRVEFFKNMGGGKLTDEQLKAFHIREGVFQQLANQKIMLQEANRQGMLASDEEVKEKILTIPAFQKDGKFDLVTYKKVLEANNYSAGGFEKMVRDEASLQQWQSYFQDRVHVSDEEVKREFILSHDKRNIKFVVLTPETAKQDVTIADAEVQKFLNDPAKLNLAKSRFEAEKQTTYKDKKFDSVKEVVARGIMAGEKLEELQKINGKLADQIASHMTADKASDAKVNALLKAYKVQVKSTGLVSRQSVHLPEIGEAKEILADAFSDKSPIDPKQGGKAKKYSVASKTIVALITESQRPDLSQLESERGSILQQVSSKKSRDLYQAWMTKLSAKAKIDTNPSIVNPE